MGNSFRKLSILLFLILVLQSTSFANSQTATSRRFNVISFPSECLDVAVDGGYAYVACGADGLVAFDIGRPTGINMVAKLYLPDVVRFITISGNYAYLVADDSLYVITVADPSKPICLYKYKLWGNGSIRGIGGDSGNIYLLYKEHVDVYSLEDQLCPVLSFSYYISKLANAGVMSGIAVREGIAYIAVENAGLMILDITDTGNIGFIGHYDNSRNFCNIDFNGNLALAGSTDGKSMDVLDITNIRNPGYLGKIDNIDPYLQYYAYTEKEKTTQEKPKATPGITGPKSTETPVAIGKGKKDKIAYITIDDGPTRNITSRNLDTLKKYGVKATFFVLPKNNLDDIYKRILAEGHVIGNHSYSHDYNYIFASTYNFINDLVKARNFIYDKLNYTTKVYRFPGGTMGHKKSEVMEREVILSELGYKYFNWDISTADTDPNLKKYGTEEQIVNLLANNIINGAKGRKKLIILMHDSAGKMYSAKALPKIIEGLDKKGYAFDVLTNY